MVAPGTALSQLIDAAPSEATGLVTEFGSAAEALNAEAKSISSPVSTTDLRSEKKNLRIFQKT